MRLHLVLLLLLLATSLFAQPVVTGISPSEGPTAGGTWVTITGTGFESGPKGAELAPVVYFGDAVAKISTLKNSTTIVALTPARVSGNVIVKVQQFNGAAIGPSPFSYVGYDGDAFQRFLVPILVPPIPGAYGSEFRSELALLNASSREARIEGLWQASVCLPCEGPVYLPAGGSTIVHPSDVLKGSPGRFIAVLNDAAYRLAANLRVYDTSRSKTNFGTEIPVVPVSAFRDVIDLTGIPNDPRFRLTLRIYGTSQSTREIVDVRFPHDSAVSNIVRMRLGRFEYDPSYAELSLVGGATYPASLNLRLYASGPATLIWAFVTVTNNETQHITTITPQPSR